MGERGDREREAFEARSPWWSHERYHADHAAAGQYRNGHEQAAWAAWMDRAEGAYASERAAVDDLTTLNYELRTALDAARAVAVTEAMVEIVESALDALQKIATTDQDDRPLPGDGWDDPFDWRRRSMRQEELARRAHTCLCVAMKILPDAGLEAR